MKQASAIFAGKVECGFRVERIDEGNRRVAWGAPNVTSCYKNSRGWVTQNWPFTLLENDTRP